MSVELRHEVAEKGFAIGPWVGVIHSPSDVLPVNLAISVLVEPVEDEVKHGLTAHEAEG